MNRPTVLIAAFVMLSACAREAEPPATEKLEFVDVEAADVLRLVREQKAKAVLVNFWAST